MFNPGTIFGHYRIEESIGSGATGIVYRAIDTNNDMTVALKLINDSLLKSNDYWSKLRREAEVSLQVDSPYIIKIFEFNEIDRIPYLAMEFAYGRELRQIIKDLDFSQKIKIVSQISQGLKAAHQSNLIHRDLKPENIMVSDDNNIKILDLGLAKTVSADSVDQFGDIEGTLYYLSPEQITGDTLSYATDLFSLGVILYELLTGRRPFEGDYSAAIIYSILHEEPPVPSDIRNDVPIWCDELTMRLLNKQAENRFENIQLVIDFIENSLAKKSDLRQSRQVVSKRSLTIIDLKNLSGDSSWDYFCIGFTDDLMREISRRTDLVVSSEPSASFERDISVLFKKYRSDFVVVGSLMKWQEKIKLSLSIYGSSGSKLLAGNSYEAESNGLFNIMAKAVDDATSALSDTTESNGFDVEDYFKTDIAAYEYYLKGKSYYQTNKPDDLDIAEDMFKKALGIDPNLAHAYSGLSDVYTFQYMAYYDRSHEKIESARKMAMKALEISPNLPEAHRSLGRYYMFIGASNSAEKSFLKSVEIDPKFAIGYRTQAWLKCLLGEHENALHWAKLSLSKAPNDLETLLLLSLINLHLGKYTVAMATLQRAIELAPDYGRAYYYLGRVYLKLGVLNLALENFEAAIKYKGDPNAHIDAAYVYLLLKDTEKAKERNRQSLDAGFFPFIANYYLGYIEKCCGDESMAEKYFKNAAETAKEYEVKDQKNIHIKAFRAMALASMGNTEKALNILNGLNEVENYDGEMLYNIARGLLISGLKEKAIEVVKLALTKHPGPTTREILLDPHFKEIKLPFDND
ncbi:MAG: protein kinase [Candidatus Zixiibacteriota bacterium]